MRKFPFSLFCFLILLQNGCALVTDSATSFGGTQAINTARGAHAKILIIESVHSSKGYHQVKFWPFHNGIGPNISSRLLRTINERVAEEIKNIGFEGRGESPVVVKGEVIHIYEGILINSIVVKVYLLDGATGRSLGVANVEGREEGLLGIEPAAEAVASGVVELLEKYK